MPSNAADPTSSTTHLVERRASRTLRAARTTRAAAVLATIAIVALALTVCGGSKSNDEAGAVSTANEKASEPFDASAESSTSTTASSDATGPTPPPTTPAAAAVPTPEFTNGLTVLWTDSKSTVLAVLPAGMVPCVYARLAAGDIAVVSALKVPSDGEGLDDGVGIRVFKASAGCDRPGLAAMFAGQLGLSQFGFTPNDAQNACAANTIIDRVIVLDDTHVSGSSGEVLQQPFIDALQACIPIRDFLLAALSSESGIPAAAAQCMADKASATVTWADVLNQSPAVETAMGLAAQACVVTGA